MEITTATASFNLTILILSLSQNTHETLSITETPDYISDTPVTHIIHCTSVQQYFTQLSFIQRHLLEPAAVIVTTFSINLCMISAESLKKPRQGTKPSVQELSAVIR